MFEIARVLNEEHFVSFTYVSEMSFFPLQPHLDIQTLKDWLLSMLLKRVKCCHGICSTDVFEILACLQFMHFYFKYFWQPVPSLMGLSRM